jgi:hypothetical protein
MATHKISSSIVFAESSEQSSGFWAKYAAYAKTQEPNAVAWWVGSLFIHGGILVPLTFLLVYTLEGPTPLFLGISLICFFVNFIANMGGASFKFTFNSFVFSLLVHIVMVASVLPLIFS